MEPILYWYPVDYFDEDESEEPFVKRRQGKIIPYQLKHEPYEVTIENGGYSFHLIFGHKENGMFLCIPDWNIGCELSELTDRDDNMYFLLNTDFLSYDNSIAIVWALYSIGNLLRFIR
jgi:hypothetical protein